MPRTTPELPYRGTLAHGRRGVAMIGVALFITIFGVLAIAFALNVQTSTQISRNERSLACSQAAAESGMEYVKHILSRLSAPIPSSDAALQTFGDRLAVLCASLKDDAKNALTVRVKDIGGGKHAIVIDEATIGGSTFGARFVRPDNQYCLRVTVTGVDTSGTSRSIRNAVSADFYGIVDYPWLFDSGAFTLGFALVKGTCNVVNAGGGFYAWGTPQNNLNYDGYVTEDRDANGQLQYDSNGRVLWRNAAGIVSAKSASQETVWVNGNNRADAGVWIAPLATADGGKNVVHANSWMPPIPTFDPTVFAYLATTRFVPSATNPTYTNVYIPANSSFGNLTGTFRGILYVESPNNISFGAATLDCAIVFADKDSAGNATRPGIDNILSFGGQVTGNPIPDDLLAIRQQLAGYGVLAPTTTIQLSGNSDQTLYGSIIAYKLDWGGGSNRTVIDGALITLCAVSDAANPSLSLSGNPDIKMKKTPRFVKPSNGLYTDRLETIGFQMMPLSYEEAVGGQ